MRLFSGWDTREEAIHHRYLRNKSFNYLLAGARAECNIAGTRYLRGALSFMYLPPCLQEAEGKVENFIKMKRIQSFTCESLESRRTWELIFLCFAVLDIYYGKLRTPARIISQFHFLL